MDSRLCMVGVRGELAVFKTLKFLYFSRFREVMFFKAMKFPYFLETREKSANFFRLREYQGPIFLQVLTTLMRMVLMGVLNNILSTPNLELRTVDRNRDPFVLQ